MTKAPTPTTVLLRCTVEQVDRWRALAEAHGWHTRGEGNLSAWLRAVADATCDAANTRTAAAKLATLQRERDEYKAAADRALDRIAKLEREHEELLARITHEHERLLALMARKDGKR